MYHDYHSVFSNNFSDVTTVEVYMRNTLLSSCSYLSLCLQITSLIQIQLRCTSNIFMCVYVDLFSWLSSGNPTDVITVEVCEKCLPVLSLCIIESLYLARDIYTFLRICGCILFRVYACMKGHTKLRSIPQ